jgi:hypothetical protein
MINWNSTLKNQLPPDRQEVLISVKGVNYISVYDAAKGIFRTNELLETFFRVADIEILWTDSLTQDNPSSKTNRSKIFRGEKKPVRKTR